MRILTVAGVLACGIGVGSASLVSLPAFGKGDSAALEARLQRIEAHEEIERLLMEYGLTLDRRDFTAYSQLFAANGSWSGSIGTFTGPAAIKAAMDKAFNVADAPSGDGSFHVLTNPIIEVKGDHATAISKWTFVRIVDKKPVIALAGRYDDTLVRENGHWRFLTRVASSASDPVANAQQPARDSAAPMKLTALDYIEIEQLSARYAFAIEQCTNHGYDYADLYTDDGYFAVSQEWGVAGRKYAEGREALAKVDGGTPEGCKDPKTMMGYGITHVIVDLVITPTSTGATGRSILLALGVGNSPTTIERQGGYEDVYVKTPKGWRIKARVHVFPGMAESVQFGHHGVTSASPSGAAASGSPPATSH